MELYAPLVYGFARKHGLQDADAADLTQDVLQAVSGGIRRLDYDPRRGSFRGWLFEDGSEVIQVAQAIPAPFGVRPFWKALAQWLKRQV